MQSITPQNVIMFKKGLHFIWGGQSGEILSSDPYSIAVKFDGNTAHSIHLPEEILQAYATGTFELVENKDNKRPAVYDMRLTAKEEVTLQDLEILMAKLDAEQCPGSETTRIRVIEETEEELGRPISIPMSPSTLRRKYNAWLDANRYTASLVKKITQQERSKRTSQELEDLIFDVIDEHYLTRESMSGREVYSILENEFRHSELYGKVKLISSSTFYERLKDLDQFEVVLARRGPEAAKRLAHRTKGMLIAAFPLQYVEIDAVHLHVGIRDDEGNYLGSLIIYFAIDRFTRMIVGYSLGIKGKGKGEKAEGYMECLAHAQCAKNLLHHPSSAWPVFGQLRQVIMDPSAAATSKMMSAFTAQFGIQRVITEASNPRKKPFIERMFRTLRDQFAVHLVGYQKTRKHGIEYEQSLEESAVLTMQDVRTLLEEYIIDVYHQNPHKGLGGDTPINVWNTKMQTMPPLIPRSPEEFELFSGFEIEPTIQASNKSVQYKGSHYEHDDFVDILLRNSVDPWREDKAPKILARFNSMDVSRISFVNPYTNEVKWADNTNPLVEPGTCLDEYKKQFPQKASQTTRKTMLGQSKHLQTTIDKKRERLKEQKDNEPNKDKPKASPLSRRSGEELDELISSGASRISTSKNLPQKDLSAVEGDQSESSVNFEDVPVCGVK